jgi:cytochrome P450
VAHYRGFMRDPLRFIAERFDSYGDLYYTETPDGGLYVLKHPDHIRDVLLAPATRFRKTHSAFDKLSEVLGDGLVTLDGDDWKRHRRMIQPAFHKSRLADYASVMADEAGNAVDRLSAGSVVDLASEMTALTLRVVTRTLFGHAVGSDSDAVADAMKTFHDSIMALDILPAWMPSPPRRRVRKAVAELDKIIHGFIDRRRDELAAGNTGYTDLLQMLVAAVDEEGDGGGLTQKEIRDELVTMFLAGHETTSHALTWTFYLLGTSSEARGLLHAELERELGGRAPTYDDLDRLPYTHQVLKEAMRLFPPAYMVARKAHEDAQIGDWHVPAGSEVVIWIYMTHRDPRWFHHPNSFKPERFAPEAEGKLPKMAYLPFAAGPRACIGKSFAMIEAAMVLATIAQRRDLRLVESEPPVPVPRITLFPKGGLPVEVVSR